MLIDQLFLILFYLVIYGSSHPQLPQLNAFDKMLHQFQVLHSSATFRPEVLNWTCSKNIKEQTIERTGLIPVSILHQFFFSLYVYLFIVGYLFFGVIYNIFILQHCFFGLFIVQHVPLFQAFPHDLEELHGAPGVNLSAGFVAVPSPTEPWGKDAIGVCTNAPLMVGSYYVDHFGCTFPRRSRRLGNPIGDDG